MRSILVPLFYLWLAGSIVVLVRRRSTHGSFKPPPSDPLSDPPSDTPTDPTMTAAGAEPFPPPPPSSPEPQADGVAPPPPPSPPQPASQDERGDQATVTVKPPPPVPSGEPATTLADALSGIEMPCDLMPLIVDRFDPRVAAFSTQGLDATTVGTAVADEFVRLGFDLTPVDVRTINAARGPDHIQIRLSSAGLDSAAVMQSRYPSAHPDALVVELRLV